MQASLTSWTIDGFQSPSRWGWSCIHRRSVMSAVSPNVSVPFSKGMVLHPVGILAARLDRACFSPLLDGDGLASDVISRDPDALHEFQSPSRWGWSCIAEMSPAVPSDVGSFSPLLEGDGLASISAIPGRPGDHIVSVPFSKGMVLHHDAVRSNTCV